MCRLKESLAQALAERDDDLAITDADSTPAEKRMNAMDRMMVDIFQVSVIEHVRKTHGEEMWERIRAKCALDLQSGPQPSDCLKSRYVDASG